MGGGGGRGEEEFDVPSCGGEFYWAFYGAANLHFEGSTPAPARAPSPEGLGGGFCGGFYAPFHGGLDGGLDGGFYAPFRKRLYGKLYAP